MTTAEKLTAIAENEPKVYLRGKRDEFDAFWDKAFFGQGSLSGTGRFAGWCWNNKTLNPPRKITVTGNCNYCFYSCGYTGNISGVVELKDVTNCMDMFGYSNITAVDYLDISKATNADKTFADARNLVTIGELKVSENLKYANTFLRATKLENITITGTIGQNGLNFQYCTKLTAESLCSIIDALADKSGDTSGTVWKLTIGSENLNKLYEFYDKDPIGDAYRKGWNIE